MEIEKNIKKSIVLFVFLYGCWISLSSALCFILFIDINNIGNLEYILYAHLFIPIYLFGYLCPNNDLIFLIFFVTVWFGEIYLGIYIMECAEKLCKKWHL